MPSAECKNPEKIKAVLEEVFGEKRPIASFKKCFYEQEQREGTTLREFSYALMALLEDVIRCKPGEVHDKDSVLRDQFAVSVRDPNLRRELKRLIRQKSDIFLSLL